jgi:hypothetical protein
LFPVESKRSKDERRHLRGMCYWTMSRSSACWSRSMDSMRLR